MPATGWRTDIARLWSQLRTDVRGVVRSGPFYVLLAFGMFNVIGGFIGALSQLFGTPVLPVTDTQILAPLVDLCLVTLEPCRVPEKAAKQMVENLKAVDAKIAGVVLNDKSGRGFKYYGSYGYYGNKQYGGYYGETDHDKPRGWVVRGMKAVWQKLNS